MVGPFATLILGLAFVAASGPAQDAAPTRAGEAAKAFNLDIGDLPVEPPVLPPPASVVAPPPDRPAGGPDTAGSPAEPAPAVPADADAMAGPARSPAGAAPFSLDTPIERLIADGRARAVLDRDLPGLSTDENLPRFRALSLRGFQPLTGGQLTDEMLRQVGGDLGRSLPRARARGATRNDRCACIAGESPDS